MENKKTAGIIRFFGVLTASFCLSQNGLRIFGVLIVLGMTMDLVRFSRDVYKNLRIIHRELNEGKYYQFQLTSQNKKWYKGMFDYFTVGTQNVLNNGKSEKQLLKEYVNGPLMWWFFYAYVVMFEVSVCFLAFFNGSISIAILVIQLFLVVSFFSFLIYIYLPGITMIALPLVGILSGEMFRVEYPKLFNVNTYENSLYMTLCMVVVAVLFSWVISEISPMYLLKNVSGVSGVLQLLFVSLIGTFVVKYGFPVLFYHLQPEMMPSYISKDLDAAGKQLNFTGSSEIKELFLQVLKDFYTRKLNDEFQKITGYFSDYFIIASADITISTSVMKRRQKKAFDLVKKVPIGLMTYDQLKKLMVVGGDKVEMDIWNNLHARQIIIDTQKGLDQHTD